jgi:hypothetical protein
MAENDIVIPVWDCNHFSAIHIHNPKGVSDDSVQPCVIVFLDSCPGKLLKDTFNRTAAIVLDNVMAVPK